MAAMVIDGTGGVKGPGGAGGPTGPTPLEQSERTERADQRFQLGELAQDRPVESAEVDPTIATAFQTVATDIQAGRITNLDAGFNAVIDHIVEARYPELSNDQRQMLGAYLHDILASDPVLGARIRTALADSLAKAGE
jgi:hypothetical protein